ncbi:MAG TPA: response regulator transcription factor [Acidimicrobiia bacterium]|nr:response regulator transcription factor [Acidimicrobiia bacterium]
MADHGSRVQTVLVVDDEPMVREVVSAYLRREGYSTIEVGDGAAAMKAVEHDRPDLIVLDVMLPKLDGYSLLAELRKSTTVPVILLTARSEEVDRVLGFELGADDYVVKPFSPRELTARVRSVLRRSVPIDAPGVVHEFGDLTIDGVARETRIDGEVVDMPPLEFDVLMFLASNPRRVFSRAELLEKVWGSSAEWQDPSTVTVHVRRIRQKIEADPDDPTRIVTVWGKGYRFEP